jgi:quercetin dioxygenase-like cupin family protein
MHNVKKEEIDNIHGLHVIRLTFGQHAILKPHRVPSHVVVVCTRGSGRWLMNGEAHHLVPGVALSVPGNVEHSVEANDELQVVITHARLASSELQPAGAHAAGL